MNLHPQLLETAPESFSRKSVEINGRLSNGFGNLSIDLRLLKWIDQLNFKQPTPVQNESIPAGIRGDDIIAIAQTGSGKTLAFGIPMAQRLLANKKGTGLIIVPTRELAIQVEESLMPICRPLNIRTAVLIGGVAMSLQLNDLGKSPRIIIATPGRLKDHLERETLSLAAIEVFVLDEADRMLDMGFIPDIKKIMKSIPENRQTMLFSATMPYEIEAIAKQFMTEPTRIEVDRSGTTPAEVSQEIIFINNQDKSQLLADRLNACSGPVLVFTRTKWMARKLTAKINKLGFATAEIHSNRSLAQRRRALEGFKHGRYQILIATDIAARGLDVSGIELVINYDMPANPEDYVHRIGRTGRAGKSGHAVSFATADQKGSIKNLESFMKIKLAISFQSTLSTEECSSAKSGQANSTPEPTKIDQPLNHRTSKKRISKEYYSSRNNSDKAVSNNSDLKRKNSKSAEYRQKDTKTENSCKSRFKRRPAKKKHARAVSRRKRRSR